MVCDSAYLTTYFDSTGLGRLERKGWAVMNGSNGTQNDNGLVVVGYGSSYPTLEDKAGVKDITFSNPIAGYGVGGVSGGTPAGQLLVSTGLPELSEFLESVAKASSAPTAADGTNKNMQPYTVRLRIQKI